MIPRTRRLRSHLAILWIALVSCVVPTAAFGQIAATPRELEHVNVTEHLDGPIPLDTPFRDHTGANVTLRTYFDGKRPVVLQFAYHSCPVVCSMITNNLAAGLKGVPWTVGKEFDVITISIDPKESLERTANKRKSILTEYGRAQSGWHFLVGDESSIQAVTKAAGFEYQYDARQQNWAHPSVVFVLKPTGHLARYLYGLEFPSNDLRLGLLEASEGRSISTVEQIILYCYHYDPQGGKYVLVARRVMQVGGGAVAIVLFGVLGMFWARELRRKGRKSDDPANEDPHASASSEAQSPGSSLLEPHDSNGALGAVRGG